MKLPYQRRAEEESRCRDKMPYPTREAASAASAYMQFQHGGGETKPYRCGICERWHLASA